MVCSSYSVLVQDRVASGKPRPMAATATVMVKEIWQNYFQSGSTKSAGGAAGEGELQEEEEDVVEEEELGNQTEENVLEAVS